MTGPERAYRMALAQEESNRSRSYVAAYAGHHHDECDHRGWGIVPPCYTCVCPHCGADKPKTWGVYNGYLGWFHGWLAECRSCKSVWDCGILD